jgi:hypothetical protein
MQTISYHKMNLLAVLAAAFACMGDLMLLFVANGGRSTSIAIHPEIILLAGAYFGVLSIPFYGLGYWAVSGNMAGTSTILRKWMIVLGCVTGVLGGTIHGMTALAIRIEHLARGSQSEVTLQYGAYFIPLWILAALAVIAFSAIYTVETWRKRTIYPRWVAPFNPAVLVVFISIFAMPFQWLQPYLIPASPNFAHLFFFGLIAMVTSRKSIDIRGKQGQRRIL